MNSITGRMGAGGAIDGDPSFRGEVACTHTYSVHTQRQKRHR